MQAGYFVNGGRALIRLAVCPEGIAALLKSAYRVPRACLLSTPPHILMHITSGKKKAARFEHNYVIGLGGMFPLTLYGSYKDRTRNCPQRQEQNANGYVNLALSAAMQIAMEGVFAIAVWTLRLRRPSSNGMR